MRLSLSRFASVATLAAIASTLLASSSHAIPQIVRRGKYLYNGNNRFYVKGLAYQEYTPPAESTDANDQNGGFPEPDSFIDPLALPDACTRDVANFKDLGINTVRVYSVNSSLNHDSCMKTLSDAGVYVILDLALPLNGSINRAEPSWNVGLLNLYAKTIDAFIKYDNILAFGVANEVVTQLSNVNVAPFIKAAARDVKAYLKSKNKSNILVAYSSTDGPSGATGWRNQLAEFLTCGSDDISVDLFGLNSYAWCGRSSFADSGYQALTQVFSSLPVVTYLSEFGCVVGVGADNRPWTEVAALLSAPMTNTFSGGIAFSYFPQLSGDDYGLTNVSGNAVTLRPDWQALKSQYAAARPPASAPSGTSTPAFQACQPSRDSFPVSDKLPPTPNAQLCNCLRNNAWSCLLNSGVENKPPVIGTLIGNACGFLSQQGSNCNPILADGSTGTYGDYSMCAAPQRLEWAMSEFYKVTSFNPQSCDFGGNATAVSKLSNATSSINSASSSCLSKYPIGVQTPIPDFEIPSDSGNPSGGGGGGGGNHGSGNGNNNHSGNDNAASRAGVSSIVVLSVSVFFGGFALLF